MLMQNVNQINIYLSIGYASYQKQVPCKYLLIWIEYYLHQNKCYQFISQVFSVNSADQNFPAKYLELFPSKMQFTACFKSHKVVSALN